jgi:putative MATE family efflux protein
MMLLTFAISVFCYTFKEELLSLMNTPQESYNDALGYVSVSLGGLFFIYGYNLISAIMRGMGDAKHPFIFISISAIVNIVLDILFVVYLSYGAVGAAFATIISQGVSFLLSVLFLWRHRQSFYLDFNLKTFWIIDREMLLALIKLGIPMVVKGMAIHFSKLFMNSWINSYGVAVSAMVGISHKLGVVSMLFSSSFNTAWSSMIGQNIGAEKYERIPLIMKTTFYLTLATSVLLSFAVLVFPDFVFGAFTSDVDVLRVAQEYVPIAVIIFMGFAFRTPMNGLIDGSGNYKLNFIVAILDGFIVRIGLAIVFCIYLNKGYIGLWLGDAIAGFTPFIIGGIYYLSDKWKKPSYLFVK